MKTHLFKSRIYQKCCTETSYSTSFKYIPAFFPMRKDECFGHYNGSYSNLLQFDLII